VGGAVRKHHDFDQGVRKIIALGLRTISAGVKAGSTSRYLDKQIRQQEVPIPAAWQTNGYQ
jgi:hypothetical protein